MVRPLYSRRAPSGSVAYLGGLTVGTSLSGRLAADTGLVLALVAYLNRPKMARTLEVA